MFLSYIIMSYSSLSWFLTHLIALMNTVGDQLYVLSRDQPTTFLALLNAMCRLGEGGSTYYLPSQNWNSAAWLIFTFPHCTQWSLSLSLLFSQKHNFYCHVLRLNDPKTKLLFESSYQMCVDAGIPCCPCQVLVLTIKNVLKIKFYQLFRIFLQLTSCTSPWKSDKKSHRERVKM